MKKALNDYSWTEDEVKEFMDNFNPGIRQGVKGNVEFEYVPECEIHGTKMFDDNNKVYYCPFCES